MKIKLAKALATGQSHIEENKPCQDAIFSIANDAASAFALADGAGSLAQSGIGASKLTKDICLYLEKNVDWLVNDLEEAKKVIAGEIQRSLLELVKENNDIFYQELGSTLLYLAVKDGRYIYGQIGDGVLVRRTGGETTILTPAKHGLYANETSLTTNVNIEELMLIGAGEIGGETDFLITSDGCGNLLYNVNKNEVSSNSLELMNWNASGESENADQELLELLEESFRPLTNDDLSIILINLA